MKVRELFAHLGASVDTAGMKKFDGAMDSSKEKVKAFAGAALKAFAAVFAATSVTEFGKFVLETARTTNEMQGLADAMGVSVEKFQGVNAAVIRLGGDLNDTSDLFATLADKALDAVGGAKSMQDDFKLLGIQVRDLKGLGTEEIFDLVAKRSAESADTTKLTAAAVRIFGDDLGRKLLPALRDGSKSFKQLIQDAEDTGQILSKSQIGDLKELDETWNGLKQLFSGVKTMLAATIAPLMNKVLTNIGAWVQANQGLIKSKLEGWLKFVANRLEVLRRAWNALDAFLTKMSGLFGATDQLGMLKAVFDALKSPIGSAIAMFLLVEDLFVSMSGGDGVIARFGKKFKGVQDALNSVKGAFGYLMRVIEEAMTNISDAMGLVGQGGKTWQEYAAIVIEYVVGAITQLVYVIAGVIKFVGHTIQFILLLGSTMREMAQTVKSVIKDILSPFDGLFEAISDGITMVLDLFDSMLEKMEMAGVGFTVLRKGLSFGRGLWEEEEKALPERTKGRFSKSAGRNFAKEAAMRSAVAEAQGPLDQSTRMQIETMQVVTSDPTRAAQDIGQNLQDYLSFGTASLAGG